MENKMNPRGFVSYYNATLDGVESTKRALTLFESIAIPCSKATLMRQIENFSNGDSGLVSYLTERLVPLTELQPDFAPWLSELASYFGKYHFENWLQPYFEEEVGEFGDQAGAEVSWHHSLQLDSFLLTTEITRRLELTPLVNEVELLQQQGKQVFETAGVKDSKVKEVFDIGFPDVALLDWPEFLRIARDPAFQAFQAKVRECLESGTPLSRAYLTDLECFFESRFPTSLDQSVVGIGVEAVIGTVLPIYGPAKALYDIYRTDRAYRRYSWLGFAMRVRNEITLGDKVESQEGQPIRIDTT
jgi:hypothetical protein